MRLVILISILVLVIFIFVFELPSSNSHTNVSLQEQKKIEFKAEPPELSDQEFEAKANIIQEGMSFKQNPPDNLISEPNIDVNQLAKTHRLMIEARDSFFKTLIQDLRKNFSPMENLDILVAIRDSLEKYREQRELLKQRAREVLRLHETQDPKLFEKATQYRNERNEYYKTLSVSIRNYLLEKGWKTDQVDLAISLFEKHLENQRLVF